MHMRKRKLCVMAAMAYIAEEGKWKRWLDKILAPTEADLAAQRENTDKLWKALMEDFRENIETVKANQIPADKVWKVARVKDNVVVLEANTLREAQEAIEKAAKQKKAKLYLLDSEPFVYATMSKA